MARKLFPTYLRFALLFMLIFTVTNLFITSLEGTIGDLRESVEAVGVTWMPKEAIHLDRKYVALSVASSFLTTFVSVFLQDLGCLMFIGFTSWSAMWSVSTTRKLDDFRSQYGPKEWAELFQALPPRYGNRGRRTSAMSMFNDIRSDSRIPLYLNFIAVALVAISVLWGYIYVIVKAQETRSYGRAQNWIDNYFGGRSELPRANLLDIFYFTAWIIRNVIRSVIHFVRRVFTKQFWARRSGGRDGQAQSGDLEGGTEMDLQAPDRTWAPHGPEGQNHG